MVFLKKKSLTPARNVQTKRKAFEVDNGNGSEFEDNSDEEMPVQKTPHNKRPKGKQSMSERKVSFELPGKKTPARTPQKNNSLFAKKQLTPAGKGRTAVQKFKGNKALQDNDIEDDDDSEVDIDDISEDEDDSDDMDDIGMDDDDSDDMDEDDGEEEQKQIQKPKKSNANQQKNMNTIKKTPVKDAENLKGLQSPKEKGLENEKRVATTINAKSLVVGNLPEDMTTDELKALSPDIVKVTKKIGYAYLLFASEDKVDTNYEALKGKELRGRSINIDYVGEKSKFTGYDAKSLFVGNLPEDVTTEELKALSPDIVKVTKKIGYAYLSFASEDKVDTNYEALQGKELRGRTIRIDYVGEKSKSHENGAKSLFVGNLPKDVTTDELKALSPDIVNVIRTVRNAYIFFASEDKVDINYEALKGKELRGKFIRIDYVGKRKIIPNLPTLAVDRIPPDASIADVAAHFSTAQQIIYDRSTLERRAIITFQNQKCANEALNSKIEIKGQMLTIERFSLNNSKQSWMKNSGYQGGSPAHSFPRFSRKMSHNSGSRRGNPARSFPRFSRKMSHNSDCRRGNPARSFPRYSRKM